MRYLARRLTTMTITTRDDIDDVLELALEIATEQGFTVWGALPQALAMWAGLRWDVEADVRYLPAGQTIRPHVSLAAGLPALELA
jgi:hypothetical protein